MSLAIEVQTSNEWHVLKGETQYGPYTYEEMIRMMQSSLVFGFDYVWAPHMEAWTPLADIEEFSAGRLAQLADKNKSEQVFSRREHERVYCKLPVYVNDQQTLWEGTVENLSEGGALVLMKNPVLLPGHIVHIHFRSRNDKDVAFNCTAQILTKRLVKSRIQHDTGIHYAVKFMAKSETGDDQIQNWIQEFKKENK
ncbi:MAG: PilZ domain-containing protein [Pseudobdellovibrionaceae bacterium]